MSSSPTNHDQLDPVMLAQLYEIARAVVEPGPELEHRIDERVTVLAASVGRALTVLAEESPTPTTPELWESAVGPALHYVRANQLDHVDTSNEL
jgi:hypothetical protein